MTTAVVDTPESEQAQAWWFLDTLVVEHRCAPGMDTVVLEMTLPAGSSPPLHIHDALDDTWYILDGQMVVRCGDEKLVVGAGHWVSMPAACRTRSGWSARKRRGFSWSTTPPASATSFETSVVLPRRESFRPSRCSRPWRKLTRYRCLIRSQAGWTADERRRERQRACHRGLSLRRASRKRYHRAGASVRRRRPQGAESPAL